MSMEKDAFVSLFSQVDAIDSVGKSGQASQSAKMQTVLNCFIEFVKCGGVGLSVQIGQTIL